MKTIAMMVAVLALACATSDFEAECDQGCQQQAAERIAQCVQSGEGDQATCTSLYDREGAVVTDSRYDGVRSCTCVSPGR